MKLRSLSYILLIVSCYACKSDFSEQTIEEEIVAIIPAGTLNFNSVEGTLSPFTDCKARVTKAETLISAIRDDENGNPVYFLLGIKGFETGTYEANLLRSNNSLENYLTTATVSHFGEPGSLITGTFEGPEGTGEFSAIREY